MPCIADANVLFPLLVRGHATHDVAWEWWERQPDKAVGTRLLTNRVAMNGAPGAPAAAVRAWRLLSDDPRSVYIEAESVSHETRLVGLVSGRESTPDPRTDAWLAALALSLDYELTTFDQGFKSFRGLKLRLLAPAGG